MTADDVNRYIGLPWQLGARGPGAYDCWGLALHCRAVYFSGGIPDVEFGDPAREMYAEKMRSGQWQIVPVPEHGGGVLHALEGRGVVYTALHSLCQLGFGRPTFYRIS